MGIRDEAERVIRGWDAHETGRGGRAVIDYDCHPIRAVVPAAGSRLEVFEQLSELHAAAEGPVEVALRAHLAYLRAVLGERAPIEAYLTETQGVRPDGWADAAVAAVGDRARAALDDLGVGWGPGTTRQLDDLEGRLDPADARDRVLAVAARYEPAVRELADTDAPFEVGIETVDVDDYWAYWLDGAGTRARMRINLRHAVFTETRLHGFVLHELLGHALQSAGYAVAAASEVPWIRLLSVNLPYQVCLEGLASALPLFVAPDDAGLTARTRLGHYTSLVHAELHLLVNHGVPVEECAAHARARVPWWSAAHIADALADRGTDPLLRSYLWSYPAGTDWFVRLADEADPATIRRVVAAAYARPLTPGDLDALRSGTGDA